jgi:hypothetical protein
VAPVTQELKDEYRNATQIDKTELPVDNKFAKELVKTIGLNGLFPINIEPIRLGGICQKKDFFVLFFHIEDTWAEFESMLVRRQRHKVTGIQRMCTSSGLSGYYKPNCHYN